MNLKDYEEKYFSYYKAFAEAVRFILKKAVAADDRLPRPQSIQCRAKGIKRLRKRLAEADKLDTETLELDRRDLAGARLIFYTNNEVDRFIISPLIHDNFAVEEDSTRIHYPTLEKKGVRYRAIHYTVQLSESRIALPEYARFAGLRCEIQVQTILNHAWSETSHDILYRDQLGDGYGRKKREDIQRRFERIMDKYLVPAGFEIQKAQQDYERLRLGKELFDKDIARSLDNAQNNNERYDILLRLKHHALPHYDDLPTAYGELRGPLLGTVQAARVKEPVAIDTTFGDMEGYRAETITELVVEIIEYFRYVDPIGTLELLIDIYRDEPNDEIRQQIVGAVKNLSEYNIDAYRKLGPMLQMALVDRLTRMSSAEVDSVRQIAITVWAEALKSDISVLKWKADSGELYEGAVPVSGQLKEVRDKAIRSLFAAYDRSLTDEQKRAILSALHGATMTPSKTQYSNELLAITLKDAIRIVDFVTERARAESYELLQHLERGFRDDYFRAKGLADDPEDRFGCQAEARALVDAILKFRDLINEDPRFLRFKVMVGSISVYPGHWNERDFDYQQANEYRYRETDRYIDEVNEESENDWFDLIKRRAETESNSTSTFSLLGNFISKLAERKPEVVDRLLAKASDNLRRFLADFLNGLALSNRPDIYERTLESELKSARNLAEVARHLRYSEIKKSDLAAHLLKRAVGNVDSKAVTECLLLGLEVYGTEKIIDSDAFLRDALTFLNDRKDCGWVSQVWSSQNAGRSLTELSSERTVQLLQNLGYATRVNYEVERILVRFALRQPEAVWDYLGARLAREAEKNDGEDSFEAVPLQFCWLEEELSKDPQLAISKGLSWFAQDRKLFRFRGGHLLSIAFPNCTSEFAAALAELVKAGGDTEAEFALEILQNYQGETSTHVVLKEIVPKFPDDTGKMDRVCNSINNVEEFSGGFGLAEAWRARRESLKEWFTDERPFVKEFAKKHILRLEQMIASAQQGAEEAREMQNRSYDEDDDDSDES